MFILPYIGNFIIPSHIFQRGSYTTNQSKMFHDGAPMSSQAPKSSSPSAEDHHAIQVEILDWCDLPEDLPKFQASGRCLFFIFGALGHKAIGPWRSVDLSDILPIRMAIYGYLWKYWEGKDGSFLDPSRMAIYGRKDKPIFRQSAKTAAEASDVA